MKKDDYSGYSSNEERHWYKNNILHREDGPAIEYPNGENYWYLEGRRYRQINLEDYVVLNHDKGKYGIMWYHLLDKDKILEHPDIPGLIIK